MAKLLSKDEARRIAANIAKLPGATGGSTLPKPNALLLLVTQGHMQPRVVGLVSGHRSDGYDSDTDDPQ